MNTVRRVFSIIGVAIALVITGGAIAEAGPGCPDKPGVCPPSDPWPSQSPGTWWSW